MPREWLSDEERSRLAAERPRLRIQAFAYGIGLAALVPIALAAMFGWR